MKTNENLTEAFRSSVREGAFHMTTVMSFTLVSFTTGYWLNRKRAEAIVFGSEPLETFQAFCELHPFEEQTPSLPLGTFVDGMFNDKPGYAFAVAKRHYPEFLAMNRWFYGGDEFPCVQLVWPDANEVFPWEPNFDEKFRAEQPDLTELGWANELAQLG